MNQATQAEETLFSAAHPQLYKKISVNQILVSSLINKCYIPNMCLVSRSSIKFSNFRWNTLAQRSGLSAAY